MANNPFVDVKVMGNEFRVACPAAEIDLLKQAVNLLNQRIEEVRQSGKIVGVERIAMMAALSISHDYVKSSTVEGFDISMVKRRIKGISDLIDTALNAPSERLL